MKNDVVEFYTWNILKKQLQKFKISNTALYNIIHNVKEQLSSIMANWNDIKFRNAILIIGSEEGSFYEPKNNIVANMVVVAIRNSLLEGVSSDSYKEYGSDYYLDDSSIKEITTEAIKYFSDINLGEVSSTIEIEYDFYKEVSRRYPVAMRALIELSMCDENDREHEYEPLEMEPFELEELNYIGSDEKKTSNTESGIAATFNDSLCNFLKDIRDGNSSLFVTDSFKMNTRNFEKTLKILEFILTHDAIFLTCNYLITNDYVSRRKELLKASHTTEEFFDKIKFLPDISIEYKDELEEIASLMIGN